MARHWAGTPGPGEAGSDGLLVIAEALGQPLQGPEGMCRRPSQPGLQLVRLAFAHEPRNVLGYGDRAGHLRMLGWQLGALGSLALIQPLWPPQDQPGRSTGREVAG